MKYARATASAPSDTVPPAISAILLPEHVTETEVTIPWRGGQLRGEDLREELVSVEGCVVLLRRGRVDEFGPAGAARSGRLLLDESGAGQPAQVEAHRVAVQANLVGELLNG